MDWLARGSVSTWLDCLKAGNAEAAQGLWDHYFKQLVPLARRQLRGFNRDVDEEDIALSALKSAIVGVQENCFPDLKDRTGLWPLLVTITARKAANELKKQRSKKRDRAREEALLDEQLLEGSSPSPDFALRLTEAIRTMVRSLCDETLETIALRKLEGYSNSDIAQELHVSTRTVDRKLARIRQEWKAFDF